MSPTLLALLVGVREVSSHSDATTDQKDLEFRMFRKSHSYFSKFTTTVWASGYTWMMYVLLGNFELHYFSTKI